jgi:predicted neuraminidase
LELKNGDLLCAWFTGSTEGAGDINIALSILRAGSRRWSKPQLTAESKEHSCQNPVLFQSPHNNEVFLFHTAQQCRGCSREDWEKYCMQTGSKESYTMQWTAVIKAKVSADDGRTWKDVSSPFVRPGSFCRNRIVRLYNDNLIFPLYYSTKGDHYGSDYSVMGISEDNGLSWKEYQVPESKGLVQASVVPGTEGILSAFFRSRYADFIYRSASADGGKTWTSPIPTELPNNNSSLQAIRLSSGRIALVYNHFSPYDTAESEKTGKSRTITWPKRRSPLAIAVSEDDGRTWPYIRYIEYQGFIGSCNKEAHSRFSYPSIVQDTEGYINVSYSYHDRYCIKHVRFREEWVLGIDTGDPAII